MTKSSQYEEMENAADLLWGVVANHTGGDWDKQSSEWREAAARARDNFFRVRKLHRLEELEEV